MPDSLFVYCTVLRAGEPTIGRGVIKGWMFTLSFISSLAISLNMLRRDSASSSAEGLKAHEHPHLMLDQVMLTFVLESIANSTVLGS